MKRYGPYRNRDGYWFWINLREDGTRKTVLVSREVLEQKIGRPLAAAEHAHHVDGDLDNNAPENLEAREGREHRSRHGRDRWARMEPDERLAAGLRLAASGRPWSKSNPSPRWRTMRRGAVVESKTRQA